MTHWPVVGLYAALNVLILFWLTIATGAARRRAGVLIGDGGHPELIRVMRGHANAIETMPMMFVMLIVAAAMGTPGFVLHALGLTFTLGRLLHAMHFVNPDAPGWQRGVGFTLGFLAMALLALGLLGHAAWSLLHG
ncbi:MAG: MAPEG family protein [Alsobacter sp.]